MSSPPDLNRLHASGIVADPSGNDTLQGILPMFESDPAVQALEALLVGPGSDSKAALEMLRTAERDTLNSLAEGSVREAVEILQTLLDSPSGTSDNEVTDRSRYLKCLRKLFKLHSILPTVFSCHNVKKESENPESGGSFSDIYEGEMDGVRVAIKALRLFTKVPEGRKKILHACYKEALVWRQLHHENVLQFLGVNEQLMAPRVCLISPMMKNGNVTDYLKLPENKDKLDALQCIIDVAEGLNFLHSQTVVHADIRGANILVKDDLHCCIADFGLAVLVETTFTNSSASQFFGTYRWSPPETLETTANPRDPARDIYSLGCTIIEILTGNSPYSPYLKTDEQVMRAIMKGILPEVPKAPRVVLWTRLVPQCLSPDPSKRPLAKEVLTALKKSPMAEETEPEPQEEPDATEVSTMIAHTEEPYSKELGTKEPRMRDARELAAKATAEMEPAAMPPTKVRAKSLWAKLRASLNFRGGSSNRGRQ